MSTSPVSSSTSATSSNQYATGSTLQSLGSGTPLQVTGLASGLNTNAIVTALMQASTQQVTNLTNQQSALTAKNTQLTNIQTALQTVATDAMAMLDPSLYAQTQTVSSTNSTLVGATAIGNTGAVQGGYQVGVTQLATSAQRTFSFTSPTAADTVTIDGQQISLAAGASARTSSTRSTPTRTSTCGPRPPTRAPWCCPSAPPASRPGATSRSPSPTPSR